MTAAGPLFEDLFREVILDHFRRPRNRGRLGDGALHAEGLNPICGDEVRLDVLCRSGLIEDVAFEGAGCSISQASASLMTERIKGSTAAAALALRQALREMLVDGKPPAEELGDLEALAGVHRFPVRVKCALLAWQVLESALAAGGQSKKED